MGNKDTVTKEYLQDADIFADVFNFHLYGGAQVIRPERLKPLDTSLVALPYGADGTPAPTQRFRDVAKLVTAKEDGNAAYLILAVENQTVQHNAEPVRIMLYDALQYASQIDQAAKTHRKTEKRPSQAVDFLSGFYLTDRLLPVITLTLHFASDPWTAPRDLHGMLAADESILRHIPNYRIHLVTPSEIPDGDFARFRTELGVALKYIKYAKDSRNLMRTASVDAAFQNVSKRTFDLINVLTNSNLIYPKGKEHGNMCKAIEDLIKEGRKELEEKIKELEKKGQEAESKAQKAESKVQEAQSKAQKAESKLQEAESKVQKAENKVREAEKEARAAEANTSERIARNLLTRGTGTLEDIAEATGLSLERVRALGENS